MLEYLVPSWNCLGRILGGVAFCEEVWPCVRRCAVVQFVVTLREYIWPSGSDKAMFQWVWRGII